MIYDDIHIIPVKIYHEIRRTGDYKLLQKETLAESITNSLKNKKVKFLPKAELMRIFLKIQDQEIDLFGVSDEFKDYFYKRNTVYQLELKVLLGNDQEKTFLEIQKVQLESKKRLLENTHKGDIAKSYARSYALVERSTGRKVDDMTLFEFNTYLCDAMSATKAEQIRQAGRHLKTG